MAIGRNLKNHFFLLVPPISSLCMCTTLLQTLGKFPGCSYCFLWGGSEFCCLHLKSWQKERFPSLPTFLWCVPAQLIFFAFLLYLFGCLSLCCLFGSFWASLFMFPLLWMLPGPQLLPVMVLRPLLSDQAVDVQLTKLTVAGWLLWPSLLPAYVCHWREKVAIVSCRVLLGFGSTWDVPDLELVMGDPNSLLGLTRWPRNYLTQVTMLRHFL